MNEKHDLVVSAREFRKFSIKYGELIEKAWMEQDVIGRELSFFDMENGTHKFFGESGMTYDKIDGQAPVYVQLIDIDELQQQINELRAMKEAILK